MSGAAIALALLIKRGVTVLTIFAAVLTTFITAVSMILFGRGKGSG